VHLRYSTCDALADDEKLQLTHCINISTQNEAFDGGLNGATNAVDLAPQQSLRIAWQKFNGYIGRQPLRFSP
jgi:hypothetical protein